MARVIGREDDGSIELANPFPPFDLGMGHRLGERQQEPALDQEANRAYRLLASPSEVARRRGHDRAARGPCMGSWRVPVPGAANAADVIGDATDRAHQPAWSTLARV